MTRLWKLLAALLGTVGSLAAAAAADPMSLSAELVASGFSEPVFVTAPEDDPRLFVVERAGKIKIVKNGSVLPTAFLDITSLVSTEGAFGFFGLAFAPDYVTSGFFYVYYMNLSDESIVARYSVSASPDVADAGSGETVFSIAQPGTDHNGATITFSPVDGYLYLGLGDGGTGPYDPLENAQDPQKLLGKMLRLDVSGGAGTTYTVSANNPFVGDPSTLDEIWAIGMRNPFRFSFDWLNGDLWIGDVGQEEKEEMLSEFAGDGGHNYGWDVMEGTLCVMADPWPPPPACNAPSLTLPFYEYDHDETSPQCSGNVIGGYVYRGGLGPVFQGLYFFGDFCTEKIWTLNPGTLEILERTSDLSPALTGETIDLIVGFGEDGFGELHVVDLGGEVFRIVMPMSPTPTPATPTPATPTPTPFPDVDGDGVLDTADNCIEPAPPGSLAGQMFNPLQIDTDGDGCGNVCDPDFNNDSQTNIFDILAMLPLGAVDPIHDLTNPIGDVVNVFDILVLLPWIGLPAGPSGTTPICL